MVVSGSLASAAFNLSSLADETESSELPSIWNTPFSLVPELKYPCVLIPKLAN